MRTYQVFFQGQDLAVEAIVEPVVGTTRLRVRVFSVREVAWSGYATTAERARGGATHHRGDEPEPGDHLVARVVALSAWEPQRREDLMRLVARASELTDGIASDATNAT